MPEVHDKVTQDMHLSKICIDPIGPEQIQNGMSVSIPCETEISVTCPAGKVCYHKESITFYETQRLIFGQSNDGKICTDVQVILRICDEILENIFT